MQTLAVHDTWIHARRSDRLLSARLGLMADLGHGGTDHYYCKISAFWALRPVHDYLAARYKLRQPRALPRSSKGSSNPTSAVLSKTAAEVRGIAGVRPVAPNCGAKNGGLFQYIAMILLVVADRIVVLCHGQGARSCSSASRRLEPTSTSTSSRTPARAVATCSASSRCSAGARRSRPRV